LCPLYIDEDDIEKPLLTIFSKREIKPNEELCFSYLGDVSSRVILDIKPDDT
jgi:[histone H3]-lysine9 N-trimethyltransferase SUV39H